MADDDPEPPSLGSTQRWSFRRHGPGLEFDRFAFFADAVYAIAMTLIVVGIEVPHVADADDPGALWSAIVDQSGSVIMFFVAFFVIGQYWLAHHRFVASLGAVDSTLLSVQLVYLAFVAFLPFPAQLMGDYVDNPVGVSALAIAMAVVSALEVVQLVLARRHDLLRVPVGDAEFRWVVVGSAGAVGVLTLSVPLAFVNPWLGIAAWFLNAPFGAWVDRRRARELGTTAPTR